MINLAQSCDPKDDRVFCTRPYTLDGMSYATDGKILVRLDSAVETDPLDDRDTESAKKMFFRFNGGVGVLAGTI